MVRDRWDDDSDSENDDLTEYVDYYDYQERQRYRQARREAWLPLAEYLPRLPGLTDLMYTCPNQMSLCLLDALHRHHPNCRLHVSTFNLRAN